jgi:hypothetical protein
MSSEDLDFLTGSFPRSIPSPLSSPNITLDTQFTQFNGSQFSDTQFSDTQFSDTKNSENTRILGAPATARYSANLDEPMQYPQGYENPSYFSPPLGVSMLNNHHGHPVTRSPGPRYVPVSSSVKSLNCIDVANHLTDCPVCSRLHKSNAHIFIGIIVALIILIFFLGRKFFE